MSAEITPDSATENSLIEHNGATSWYHAKARLARGAMNVLILQPFAAISLLLQTPSLIPLPQQFGANKFMECINTRAGRGV
ncbi:hypothetical protein GOL25_29565 [Sinorhizobium medicae]|nr:hypothetical protein [Sinorhizobium medicae]